MLDARYSSRKIVPGNQPGVHAAIGRRGAIAGRGPPGRKPPSAPAVVLGAGDRFEITVAQFDEAARRDGAARHPPAPAGHDRGHDRTELKDVVLADEVVEIGPRSARVRLRVARHRRAPQPVTLVPVPGHPRPGVLDCLAVHQEGPLEGVQQVEDRPGAACAVGGGHEHRDARVQPGHPPRLVHPVLGQGLGDDHGGFGRRVGHHGIQGGQKLVLPGLRPRCHLRRCPVVAVGGGGQVLAAQVLGAPVHQQHALERMRVQRVRGGPVVPLVPSAPSAPARPNSVRIGGAAGGSGLDEPAAFPGAAGELKQDGQG